jgi:hypothetical protein
VWGGGPPDSALDLSAGARPDLFFSILLPGISDSRAHRRAGILPSNEYLEAVARQFGVARFWFAPTLLWFSTGPHMLSAICWVGMIASLLVVCNVWPRATLFICLVCFLSFVSAVQDFSGYQSDGMLLEAGFISLFFVPPGFLPGLGGAHPPPRASLFLLQWEWFRIYFESGMVKLAGGDAEWRNFTAMDEYYQNGPLPTWIGWYVQHLPHWFHAFATGATLGLELGLVFMLFLPRRWRIVCFFIVTAWQIPVILTANYTFLNYLVLVLGFLLLDDRFLLRIMPERWRVYINQRTGVPPEKNVKSQDSDSSLPRRGSLRPLQALRLSLTSVMLIWIFYATTAQMIWIVFPRLPLPTSPVAALDPFRIANRYGLFAVMTRGRYEIEFQGSNDGNTWTPYPFRYKPQALNDPPKIFAPYQPRFDWNLWFASLGDWQQNDIVPLAEQRLLENDVDVIALFQSNPFVQSPPRFVRAVLWQYWFTSMDEKRRTGNWWRREFLGLYAPEITINASGKPAVVQWPDEQQPHE